MAVLVLGRRDDGKRERWIPERRERSMDTPKAPIEPTRIYTPAETAELLGFRGKSPEAAKNSVYAIDPAELPRTKTGANGGRSGFLGLVILRFLVARTEEPGVRLADLVRFTEAKERAEHLERLVETKDFTINAIYRAWASGNLPAPE